MEILHTFLVRHGEYNDRKNPEELTELGMTQAIAAGRDLQMNHRASVRDIILTSNAPRAVQTAHLLADVLDKNKRIKVFRSTLVENAMLNPRAVYSLKQIADTALKGSAIYAGARNLIIVGHEPLIAAVTGNPSIKNGSVTEVAIDDWQNPNYSQREAEMFLPELATL